jgi:hypothetical protein
MGVRVYWCMGVRVYGCIGVDNIFVCGIIFRCTEIIFFGGIVDFR